MSKKCEEWLKTHSAVDATNVASVRMSLADISLALEVQSFVHSTLSKAMCELVS